MANALKHHIGYRFDNIADSYHSAIIEFLQVPPSRPPLIPVTPGPRPCRHGQVCVAVVEGDGFDNFLGPSVLSVTFFPVPPPPFPWPWQVLGGTLLKFSNPRPLLLGWPAVRCFLFEPSLSSEFQVSFTDAAPPQGICPALLLAARISSTTSATTLDLWLLPPGTSPTPPPRLMTASNSVLHPSSSIS